MPESLPTAHGELPLPAFLPDATRAVVRTVDAQDLEGAGIKGLMVNALHVAHRPGASLVEAAGGLHRFMGWRGPVMTDSGGYQAYSLTRENKALGSVSDEGFTYRFDRGDEKKLLTPEKAVERQLQLGTDVVITLDQCTHPDLPAAGQRESVQRTIAWGRRCKEAFARRLDAMRPEGVPPKLFAVVQGGDDPALRRECAEGLQAAGFDGYGYGGWPVDDDGRLVDAVGLTARLLPEGSPKLALGIGKPENIVDCRAMGYAIFDCTLPTRDGRHGRLYTFRHGAAPPLAGDWCERINIGNERFTRDGAPVEAECDCVACARYSRAYLHHLFAIQDAAALRLATIHNLRFFARLFDRLRAGG